MSLRHKKLKDNRAALSGTVQHNCARATLKFIIRILYTVYV